MQRKSSIFSLMLLSTLSLNAVNIEGTISYERINPIHSGSSTLLDKSNITEETAKQIIVKAIDSSGQAIASTSTNDNGEYFLKDLPANTDVKIRAYARIFKNNKWDTKVIDNTNGDAQYVLEGTLISTGTQNTRRNLKAPASTKQSPPFAILDSIYQAIKKVDSSDSNVVFPPLNLNWSVNNVPSGGSIADGQIITTLFDGENNIYILGDQQGDTDEYDDHIMIHEWGHYFEAKFSRADSIGGSHGAGDYSDIRLAFGEGWGNALSAIITDDPIYFDTSSGSGWNMNIETATKDTPGWFSEASIQRILYDLYDSHDDGTDQLSLGFKPLYDVLTGPQKTTQAFTSIFTFITALKKEESSHTAKIDSIVRSEEIATINDIYGSDRLNNVESIALPIYRQLTINKTETNVCTSTKYGTGNKLNNHKFIYFTINEEKPYPIKVIQTNGRTSDPDFALFQTSPFKKIALSEEPTRGSETATFTLASGSYILNIIDDKNIKKACFNVSVGQNSTIPIGEESSSDSSSSVGITLPENKLLALLLIIGITLLPALFIRTEPKI